MTEQFANKPRNATLAAIWLPVATGLLLRLLWMTWVSVKPVSDSNIYHQFAKNLAMGHGYAYDSGHLTAYWAVGTSALYGAVYSVFGTDPQVIAWLNLALSAVLLTTTGWVAHRQFGERAARWAVWLVALWPALIQYTTILASELLFMTLLMVVVYLFGAGKRGYVQALAWSLVLVAAIYVRSVALPLLILLPLSLALRTRKYQQAILVACISVGMYAALSAPWKARNEKLWGEPGVMATNFGANLWMGNNPNSNGAYSPLPDRRFDSELAQDQWLKQEALTFIKQNPGKYVWLCLRRVVDSFGRETIGVGWNADLESKSLPSGAIPALKGMSSLYWLLMLGLGTTGFLLAVRRGAMAWHDPMVFVCVAVAAPAILIVSQDRYHVPLDPFLAILAAWFLSTLTRRPAAARSAFGATR